MLRKGSSWLGGLVLAGLVLGCTAGSETGEETIVSPEDADEVEIEAVGEEAATAQTHVIYMEATQRPDGDGTAGPIRPEGSGSKAGISSPSPGTASRTRRWSRRES